MLGDTLKMYRDIFFIKSIAILDTTAVLLPPAFPVTRGEGHTTTYIFSGFFFVWGCDYSFRCGYIVQYLHNLINKIVTQLGADVFSFHMLVSLQTYDV